MALPYHVHMLGERRRRHSTRVYVDQTLTCVVGSNCAVLVCLAYVLDRASTGHRYRRLRHAARGNLPRTLFIN